MKQRDAMTGAERLIDQVPPQESGAAEDQNSHRRTMPAQTCENGAMTKPQSVKLSENGLRYAAKPPGSPFVGTGNTRSCFLCGKHRQAAQLKAKRVLGRSEMVCAPACNAVE
jgi:hypothetical protein